MNQIRSAVPESLVPVARSAYRLALNVYGSLRYRGSDVNCPCCGWEGTRFLPFRGRPNAICPRCGARERHRFLMVHLKRHASSLGQRPRILHFAPEGALSRWLKGRAGGGYITTDLDPRNVNIAMDITNILFRDDIFDCVVCSHILEHVPDDTTAIAELHRVLHPGGSAFIMVPIYEMPEGRTFEDPSITSAEARLRAYGQIDHVRKYGDDFRDRLAAVDWTVTEYRTLELGDDVVRRHALGDRVIFQCQK